MLDPKIQEALDNLKTVDLSKLQPIPSGAGYYSDVGFTDMGFNGLSTADLTTLTPATLPTITTTSITPLPTNTISAGLTTVQLSAIGGVGQGYTLSSGTASSLNWQNPYYTTSAIGATVPAGKAGLLQLKGEDADIEINGKSVVKLLERIEERLNLLEPNTELEKDWDDLRRLGERYRRLEKKCKEKAETWKKLKAMQPPTLD
jgi:hypothetical protein